jgi:hypothetical protein
MAAGVISAAIVACEEEQGRGHGERDKGTGNGDEGMAGLKELTL